MLSRGEERFVCEQLSLYNCTEREVEIYLQALKSGPSSVQQLARQLGQNRVTVHSAAAQLARKGLLYETRSGKRRLLAAEEPDALFRLLRIKENELENAKANLGYAVGLLRRVQSPSGSRPDVQFYEGTEGFKRMLELTLSAKGEFLGLINVELFAKHLSPEYLEDFFQRRAEKGIHSRLIWPHHSSSAGSFAKRTIPKSKVYKMAVRYLPSAAEPRSGFISWNNCISLKSFSAGQITCTIIENNDIADFYRSTVFEPLWKISHAAK